MSNVETLNGTVYWQEIRDGLFVHNEKWNETIDRLPDLISSELVLSKLQSVDQLLQSGLKGTGTIGFRSVEVAPNSELLMQEGPLFDEFLQIENLFLQWVYQFYLVESFANNFHSTPLPKWPLPFLNLTEETLHTMTYISALIFLYEEGNLKSVVTRRDFQSTEVMVQDKVRDLTSTLYSKCAEYGESFRRHGLQGTLPRLWDKIARYAQLSALGRNATYEPKLDSAKDLLGYCIIAWSLLHELEDVPVLSSGGDYAKAEEV
jgi:hypothetical protein